MKLDPIPSGRQKKMEITRPRIISALHDRLLQEPGVLAVWLEGADAVGRVDEFSDLDLCCSVEPGLLAQAAGLAREALEMLGPLDLISRQGDRPDFQEHTVFHLAGTSEFLLIDFVAYRAGRGSQFVAGDDIEKPLVLFDRGGAITFQPREKALAQLGRGQRLNELRETVAQYSRLQKYLKRGDFLEAFGYYHKWLLVPLIEALRMKYTPLHPDYYIVHISRHLPEEALARLEDLFKIHSIEELESKSEAARQFFDETVVRLANVTGSG